MPRPSDRNFEQRIAEYNATGSPALAEVLAASNIVAHQIEKTMKLDWTDSKREQGGIFGVVSHDTRRTCTTKSGEQKCSFKIVVSQDKSTTFLSTVNAQTLCVPTRMLRSHNNEKESVPLLSNLQGAARALAVSYLQSDEAAGLVESLNYTEALKSVEQAALENITRELQNYDKVECYTDCNITAMGADEEDTLLYEYQIVNKYHHDRHILVGVDRGGETSWGYFKQGSIGSFHYEMGRDGKMTGSRHAFEAQMTTTEFSLKGLEDAMDATASEREEKKMANFGTNMLAGMKGTDVTSILVLSFKKRRPKEEAPRTRGISTRGGRRASADDEVAGSAPPSFGVYATNITKGPEIYKGIDTLDVDPKDLEVMGGTMTMKQDAIMKSRTGDTFEKEDFEKMLGNAIVYLAEMNTTMAEIVSEEEGNDVCFTNVQDADTAITPAKIAQGLVSEDEIESIAILNARLRAKRRGKDVEEMPCKACKIDSP